MEECRRRRRRMQKCTFYKHTTYKHNPFVSKNSTGLSSDHLGTDWHLRQKGSISVYLLNRVTGWLSGSSAGLEIQRSRVRIPSGALEKLWVFRSQKGCADSLSVCVPNPHVYMHACETPCMHVKDPVVHVKSSVDYGNTKITSMHMYPRRWNVAAQVAEELKMVTCASPPIEERRKNKIKK